MHPKLAKINNFTRIFFIKLNKTFKIISYAAVFQVQDFSNNFVFIGGVKNVYPMVEVISSETSGFSALTVTCMVTPSDKANLARTRTSKPPRNTPEIRTFI